MQVYYTIYHHSYFFDVNMNKRNELNIVGAIDTQKKDKDDKKKSSKVYSHATIMNIKTHTLKMKI